MHLSDAIEFAKTLHAAQCRKGTNRPYFTHLEATMLTVRKYGGTERQQIAALLHDAIEDQPNGGNTEKVIEEFFGPEVLRIVKAVSNPSGGGDWKSRKLAAIAKAAGVGTEAALVEAADKLSNATDILQDFASVGPAVFARFKAPKAEVLWYYRKMADVLAPQVPPGLADELEAAVSAMERI
jgi:(p)ppGpp synthase/HD superfamily hydrolase